MDSWKLSCSCNSRALCFSKRKQELRIFSREAARLVFDYGIKLSRRGPAPVRRLFRNLPMPGEARARLGANFEFQIAAAGGPTQPVMMSQGNVTFKTSLRQVASLVNNTEKPASPLDFFFKFRILPFRRPGDDMKRRSRI